MNSLSHPDDSSQVTPLRQPTIRRAKHGKDNPYFMMLRETAQDRNLSYEARGMLAYILSRPDDWHVQVADLIIQADGGKTTKAGKSKVYSILDELAEHSYIVKPKRYQDDKGQWVWTPYEVYERPYTDLPDMGKPETDEPSTGKQDILHSTEEQSTDTEKTLAPADADAPRATPEEVDSAIYGPVEKPERKRDELFDAVASQVFDIQNPDALNGQGGRIAAISNWLKGKAPAKAAKARGVGQLERPATAQELQKFCRWYQGKYRNVSIPKDVGKFAEHFLAYRGSAAPAKLIGGTLDMSDVSPDDPNYYRIQTERMLKLWEAQNERRSA